MAPTYWPGVSSRLRRPYNVPNEFVTRIKRSAYDDEHWKTLKAKNSCAHAYKYFILRTFASFGDKGSEYLGYALINKLGAHCKRLTRARSTNISHTLPGFKQTFVKCSTCICHTFTVRQLIITFEERRKVESNGLFLFADFGTVFAIAKRRPT